MRKVQVASGGKKSRSALALFLNVVLAGIFTASCTVFNINRIYIYTGTCKGLDKVSPFRRPAAQMVNTHQWVRLVLHSRDLGPFQSDRGLPETLLQVLKIYLQSVKSTRSTTPQTNYLEWLGMFSL